MQVEGTLHNQDQCRTNPPYSNVSSPNISKASPGSMQAYDWTGGGVVVWYLVKAAPRALWADVVHKAHEPLRGGDGRHSNSTPNPCSMKRQWQPSQAAPAIFMLGDGRLAILVQGSQKSQYSVLRLDTDGRAARREQTERRAGNQAAAEVNRVRPGQRGTAYLCT